MSINPKGVRPVKNFFLFPKKVLPLITFSFLGFVLIAGVASTQEVIPTTLFLLVRTGNSLSRGDLEKTLILGLEGTNCKYKAPIIAKPIPAGVFHEIERMVGKGSPVAPRLADDKEISFAQVPVVDGVLLRASLPKKTMQLREISIKYKTAGVIKYTINSEDPKTQFLLVTPGVYTMAVPPDDEPVSYQSKVLDKGEDIPDMKGEMDLGPKYYTIRINNFVGDQKKVFEFVSNSDTIANKLVNIETIKDYSFVFANLDTVDSIQKPPIDDKNVYYPRVSQVRGANTRRVWILFPLTAAEAESEREKFRKFDFLELPKEIKKNSEVITIGKIAELKADSRAKWFELTTAIDRQNFSRGIQLIDLPKMQDRFSSWHRLVVYEFDDGANPPQAIRVRDEKTGQGTYVLDEDLRDLPSAISQRLKAIK